MTALLFAIYRQRLASPPRFQVALGNVSVMAVVLPLLSATRQRARLYPKRNFEDKCVPKYNLGTRSDGATWERGNNWHRTRSARSTFATIVVALARNRTTSAAGFPKSEFPGRALPQSCCLFLPRVPAPTGR